MDRIGPIALLMAALVLPPVDASAQVSHRFGAGMGGAMLLANKGVQRELKVDPDQARKLDAFAVDLREQGQVALTKIHELPPGERGAKLVAVNDAWAAALGKAVETILRPDQVKRFEQIRLQQRGPTAFTDPSIVARLRLTDEQKATLRRVNDASLKSRGDIAIGPGQDREAALKRLVDHNRETVAKLTALLSAEQKATWTEMVGEPFEFRFEPPPVRATEAAGKTEP